MYNDIRNIHFMYYNLNCTDILFTWKTQVNFKKYMHTLGLTFCLKKVHVPIVLCPIHLLSPIHYIVSRSKEDSKVSQNAHPLIYKSIPVWIVLVFLVALKANAHSFTTTTDVMCNCNYFSLCVIAFFIHAQSIRKMDN